MSKNFINTKNTNAIYTTEAAQRQNTMPIPNDNLVVESALQSGIELSRSQGANDRVFSQDDASDVSTASDSTKAQAPDALPDLASKASLSPEQPDSDDIDNDKLSALNDDGETASGETGGNDIGDAGESGGTNYSDDSGSLIDGVDRLGMLGTDYWKYESQPAKLLLQETSDGPGSPNQLIIQGDMDDNILRGGSGSDVLIGDPASMAQQSTGPLNYNVCIILDASSSMSMNGVDNMSPAKLAVAQLLLQTYAQHEGQVNVKVIGFSSDLPCNFSLSDMGASDFTTWTNGAQEYGIATVQINGNSVTLGTLPDYTVLTAANTCYRIVGDSVFEGSFADGVWEYIPATTPTTVTWSGGNAILTVDSDTYTVPPAPTIIDTASGYEFRFEDGSGNPLSAWSSSATLTYREVGSNGAWTEYTENVTWTGDMSSNGLIENILNMMPAGGTNYIAGIDEANDWFQTVNNPDYDNVAYFVSDGEPSTVTRDQIIMKGADETFTATTEADFANASLPYSLMCTIELSLPRYTPGYVDVGEDYYTVFYDHTTGELTAQPEGYMKKADDGTILVLTAIDLDTGAKTWTPLVDVASWATIGLTFEVPSDYSMGDIVGYDSAGNVTTIVSDMYYRISSSGIIQQATPPGSNSWSYMDTLDFFGASDSVRIANGFYTNDLIQKASEIAYQELMDALGGEVAFNAVGINLSGEAIAFLDKLDNTGGAQNIKDAFELQETLENGSTSYIPVPGDDTLDGGDGNDLLFGDALYADFMLAGSSWLGDDGTTYTWNNTGSQAGLENGDSFNIIVAFMNDQYGKGQWNSDDLRAFILNNEERFGHNEAYRGGNDTLNGGNGDDTLYGQGGNDILNGGDGNDVLYGGSGNDVLRGGRGDDTMTGGTGKDIFAWTAADRDGGTDIITDFSVGEDKLRFEDLLAPGDDLSWILTSGLGSVGVADGGGMKLTLGDQTVIVNFTGPIEINSVSYSSFADIMAAGGTLLEDLLHSMTYGT